MKALFILFACIGFAASAAEVIAVSSRRNSVAISHDSSSPWVMSDRACIVQNETDVVCGVIAKTTSKGAIVKLDTAFDGLVIGDKVRKAGSARRPSSADTVETFPRGSSPSFDLTAGVGATLSSVFPTLHIQYAVSRHVSLGAMGYYSPGADGTATVTSLGGLATFNYYGTAPYRGLWIHAGLGYGTISINDTTLLVSQSAGGLTGQLTAGYRHRFGKLLNGGIAGGIRYFADPNFATIAIASGIMPLLNLDFGINF